MQHGHLGWVAHLGGRLHHHAGCVYLHPGAEVGGYLGHVNGLVCGLGWVGHHGHAELVAGCVPVHPGVGGDGWQYPHGFCEHPGGGHHHPDYFLVYCGLLKYS